MVTANSLVTVQYRQVWFRVRVSLSFILVHVWSAAAVLSNIPIKMIQGDHSPDNVKFP